MPFTLFRLLGAVLVSATCCLLILPLVPAAAQGCDSISLDLSRTKVARLLSETGYQRQQSQFLMTHSRSELYGFPTASLTHEAKACGRKAIQAMVFDCIAKTLKSTLAAVPNPDAIRAVTLWGRDKLSAREAAFIGMFHACQAAARARFERH